MDKNRKISATRVALADGLHSNCIVEIDNLGKIVSVEKDVENIDSRAGVEMYNGLLMPGLINCHSHLEYSYVKGMIGRGGGLPRFIDSIIDIKYNVPIEDSVKIDAARKWDKIMFENGIQVVGDHTNYEYTTPIKQDSKMYYHSFVEMLDEDGVPAMDLFARGIERVKEQAAVGVKATVSPHATYTLADEFLAAIGSAENKGILSVHFKESVVLGGKNETDRIFSNISSNREGLLLIHSIYATEEDITKAITQYGSKVTVVPCPLSNLYIEERLPDFDMFIRKGVRIALGTDSLSSNEVLSILEEMKCVEKHYPDYSLESILAMATVNGAEALGITDWAGSIAEGKCPGIVLIEGVDFIANKLTENAEIKRLV